MVTQQEIDAVNWQKTTYIEPHEYILVMDHPELVEAITTKIKTNAVVREFLGSKYRYWIFGGYRYWCMGVVLNRAIAEL